MSEHISDQELISSYLSGNEAAFSELVQRYMKAVYSFIYSLTRSESEAEDITQETFLKAWKNIKRYKKEYTFKTWILTIARNSTYDFFRKRKHIPFSTFEDVAGNNPLTHSLTDEEISSFELSIQKENEQIIKNAIEQLSPLYREVIELRFGEDLSFEEISIVIKRPMNTVKSQARRAVMELKKILNKNAPNGLDKP